MWRASQGCSSRSSTTFVPLNATNSLFHRRVAVLVLAAVTFFFAERPRKNGLDEMRAIIHQCAFEGRCPNWKWKEMSKNLQEFRFFLPFLRSDRPLFFWLIYRNRPASHKVFWRLLTFSWKYIWEMLFKEVIKSCCYREEVIFFYFLLYFFCSECFRVKKGELFLLILCFGRFRLQRALTDFGKLWYLAFEEICSC